MKERKGTKTEANLRCAYFLESVRIGKHTQYAAEAAEKGAAAASRALTEIAQNELANAQLISALLESRSEGAKELAPMEQGVIDELRECAGRYTQMAQQARDEGFEQVAGVFEDLAFMAQQHVRMCLNLLGAKGTGSQSA